MRILNDSDFFYKKVGIQRTGVGLPLLCEGDPLMNNVYALLCVTWARL